MKISLFGVTTVETEGALWGPADLGGAKPRQILAMLALELGSPVSKDLIAERLWDGDPPASYLSTLESYVCGLRRRLGVRTRGPRGSALVTVNRAYLLAPEVVTVDVVEVRDLLRDGGPTSVLRALDLASAPLLASEPYATWADRERSDFDSLLARACLEAAGSAREAGRLHVAGRLAGAAVAYGDLDERAWEELIRVRWLAGDRAGALHAYADVRRLLRADLGISPGRRVSELYAAILRDDRSGPGSAGSGEISALARLLCQALDGTPAAAGDEEPLRDLRRLLLQRRGLRPLLGTVPPQRTVPAQRTAPAHEEPVPDAG